jgi:hypothetical protein
MNPDAHRVRSCLLNVLIQDYLIMIPERTSDHEHEVTVRAVPTIGRRSRSLASLSQHK